MTTSIVNIAIVFDKGDPITLALAALDRGDLEVAERGFTALLDAAAPRSAAERALAHNKRGVARIRLGRHDDAHGDFLAALEADPRYAPALANLGNLLLDAGDTAGAIARYEAAIAADPDYAVAYLNLSAAYKRTGRIADGVRALRRARALEDRKAASVWRWRRRP